MRGLGFGTWDLGFEVRDGLRFKSWTGILFFPFTAEFRYSPRKGGSYDFRKRRETV
jgi:hypothetical protein